MSLRICVVGIELPIETAEYIGLEERRSLSEYDIIIFSPAFHTSISSYDRYAGLASVSHDVASKYFGQANHWKDWRLGFTSGIRLTGCIPSPDSLPRLMGQLTFSIRTSSARFET